MSSYRLGPSDASLPWFRIGRLEVTTTVFVIGLVLASWLAWLVQPSMPQLLYLDPAAVAEGELWRLVTWPLADSVSLWSALTLFFFWYFGTELESLIGRSRMIWLLVGIATSLTVAALLVTLLFRGAGVALGGIDPIEFVLLLLWIAEYPNRRLFFNIPAWVFGAVIVGVQVLVSIGSRGWPSLAYLMVGLILSALVGRAVGLLAENDWIPKLGGKRRPKPAKQAVPTRADRRRTNDRERLDALLDKINEVGIGGLSEAERRELHAIRERLRSGR